jgi:hypothetical protein
MRAGVTLVALALLAGLIAVWALVSESLVVLIVLGALWLTILLAWMVRAAGDLPVRRRRARRD